MFTVIAFVVLILLVIVYFYLEFHKVYRLWTKQNVPTLKPSFPIGSLDLRVAHTNFGIIIQDFYRKLKSKGDYAGMFFLNKPVLLVLSPEFARTVLVRDFQYFINRGVYFNKEDDPLSANLFFIENNDWRNLRKKLTPTFTSSNMKMMFHTIYDVADELVKHLKEICGENDKDVEITDVLARYNTDVIVTCAFGVQCNSLDDEKSEFRAIGKKMLTFSRIRLCKLYAAMLFRKQARFMGFRLLHDDVSHFIIDMCNKTIQERRTRNIRRKDFMQLLIDLYSDDSTVKNDGLTLEEIAAQVFLFYFAGFETSSTAMTYALYELALHTDIQEKARKEINRICEKYGNEINYEGIMEMTYLEQIIYGNFVKLFFSIAKISCTLIKFNSTETMRKHPAVGTLHRVIKKDYVLPNGGVAPKGTYVIIPAVAFHNDPEYFPNPDKFDPERFNEENKLKRHPFAYLPFGEGPRICIGLRFGMLQTKLGLAMLLKHLQFEICSKTKIPIQIDNVSLLLLPEGGVWLNVSRI